LGVSQRMFHFFYGTPTPNERLSRWTLPVLNLAIIGEVAGLMLMRARGHAWAGLWYGSSILFAAAIVTLVVSWRILAPVKEGERSLKFMRTAYVWLFVSLAMSLLCRSINLSSFRRSLPARPRHRPDSRTPTTAPYATPLPSASSA